MRHGRQEKHLAASAAQSIAAAAMGINTRRAYSARRPSKLERITLPPEMSEMIQKESIEVFTEMVNAGQSFQHALMAVFLSGMSAASEAQRNS